MDRTPVTSNQITSIGYDAASRVLEIEFKQHNPSKPPSVYQYFDVPPEAHAALVNAESIGKHFTANVKHGFEYKRIEAEG